MREGRGRALLFDGVPGTLRLADAAVPEPGDGEVLVSVDTALVCGSDLHTIDGRRSAPTPLVLGHETVGVVERVGAGRGDALALGDRVVWGVVAHCGACLPCGSGWPQKCRAGFKFGHARAQGERLFSGGFAEVVLLPREATVLRVPDSLPSPLAALAACTSATACAVVEAAGDLEGRRVAVIGAGALGLQTALLCREAGAAEVTCVDPSPARRAAVRAIGCDAVAPSALEDGTAPVDAVLELAGDGGGVAALLPRLSVGARVVLAGAVFPAPPLPLDMETLIRACASVHGIHNYRPEHLARALAFLEAHRETLESAIGIGPLLPLERWPDVLEAARSGRWHRAGFAPDGDGAEVRTRPPWTD